MKDEWIIRVYQHRGGFSPFGKWFSRLRDEILKQEIDARLNRIRTGNVGDMKSVGGGVLELRIHYGPGYRVYFAMIAPKVVLLLCAGTKATQQRDIEKAKRYLRYYGDEDAHKKL
jgi:putative addiction module killer protein